MKTPHRLGVVVAALGLIVAACGQNSSSRSPSASGSASPTAVMTDSPSRSGASPDPSRPAGFDPRSVAVELEQVADGFDQPLGAVPAGDGSGRLFVVEQGGTIRIVEGGNVAERPFLDISERLVSGGERGLLGLAFHPGFPDDPRLFVNYTAEPDGATIVSSFEAVDDASRADPDSERVLLQIDQPFPNHNGGALVFGPDGMLYIATGDGGSGGDPLDNGQRTDTHLGKILRIDVDRTSGDRPYGLPADNAFPDGDGGLPEIWHYGLRNPWRMTFDSGTGDLWIGDVGQGAIEEIDVVRAGTGAGLNFGWRLMEGSRCRVEPCPDGLVPPYSEYPHENGACTVVGGYVYRGSAQPALAGGYVFADYCSSEIWAIDPSGEGPQEPVPVGEGPPGISSFGEDESGELYLTSLHDGLLMRVVATPR